jgi:hypothetical protein
MKPIIRHTGKDGQGNRPVPYLGTRPMGHPTV